MKSPLLLHNYEWECGKVSYYAPDLNFVEKTYSKNLQRGLQPFPYWAKVWPSALGLCRFLIEHPYYICQKNILELAGGLGLPSLVSAQYARQVCFSDYIPEAVEVMERSVAHNSFKNIDCKVLDWNHLPPIPETEIVLLSDINYEPLEFENLITVIESFVQKGIIVILSTPHRLMARPFIETIIPWRQHQQEISIVYNNHRLSISIFVLVML